MTMTLGAIWRYPAKSMAGERLAQVDVDEGGVAGDRVVQVVQRGRVVTARTRPALLALSASLGADGEPCVDGRPWRDAAVAAAVVQAAGEGAALRRAAPDERFDVLALTVATDGALAALGADARRLRPNLIVHGVEGLAEQAWPGRVLRIGHVRIGVARRRPRCVMTTFDPDTQAQDPGVLRKIARDFGGALALDCAVLAGGELVLGAEVWLEDETSAGG